MTPTLPLLLGGLAASLAAPAPPEAGGDYAASRVGLVAMLLMLAAQEAERGPGAARQENRAIIDLLEEARAGYPEAVRSDHERWAGIEEWRGPEGANAALRDALIRLHEAAEATGDAPLQRRILSLYVAMAHARRLDLPGA